MSEETTCEVCQGSGWSGHPDSGDMCYKCKGAGGYAAANDDGIAMALYIELAAYFDPKLTEHDKRIVLDKIKYRASNTLIEEQAARIADLEAQVSEWRQKWEEDDRDVRYFSKAMKAQQDRAVSQARLSEAVKVLKAVSDTSHRSRDREHYKFPLVIMELVDAFIATLGENKNEA